MLDVRRYKTDKQPEMINLMTIDTLDVKTLPEGFQVTLTFPSKAIKYFFDDRDEMLDFVKQFE